MHSLKDKFDEVCLRLGQGRRLESMGSDPIYNHCQKTADFSPLMNGCLERRGL